MTNVIPACNLMVETMVRLCILSNSSKIYDTRSLSVRDMLYFFKILQFKLISYKQDSSVHSDTFEDKFKANLERGNAELEKRRQVLQEAERREQERRAQKQREEQERREKEAREAEERRRKEEEKRLERLRELERQREEERQREIERKEVNVSAKKTPAKQVQRCDSRTLFRLHSGSSSARGKKSGRGDVEESSRSRGSRSRTTSSN